MTPNATGPADYTCIDARRTYQPTAGYPNRGETNSKIVPELRKRVPATNLPNFNGTQPERTGAVDLLGESTRELLLPIFWIDRRCGSYSPTRCRTSSRVGKTCCFNSMPLPASKISECGRDEVGAAHFIRGVRENAFEIRLAGLLHRVADLGIAGGLPVLTVRSTADRGRRDAERHAGACPSAFGQHQRDGLGRSRSSRDDSAPRVRPPFQSFFDGPSTVFCVAV